MTGTLTPNQLLAELAHFTGTSGYVRHWYHRRLLYTDGVQHLAERAGAHWLVDEIAFQHATGRMRQLIEQDGRLGEIQFWTLTVHEDRSAVLTLRADSDVPPVIECKIPATDFPLESIDLWMAFDGKHWVLYLPSEH